MNPLRRRLVDWLFGFGQPVPDDYAPPMPVPAVSTVPVCDLAPVKEQPAERPTVKDALFGPRCIVCHELLANSPSDFFCSDACQRAWDGRQANPLPSAVQLPDGTLLNPTRRVG